MILQFITFRKFKLNCFNFMTRENGVNLLSFKTLYGGQFTLSTQFSDNT